ncbi:hypothetical protein KR074_000605 [Drosophila pseudoananassae]|nr:hypothetical protein KR074_000605 [Drosophila pseudoananassae]
MPPKKGKKQEEPKKIGPQPPNVFLYIQLAAITRLPKTRQPLEIHISQGGSLLVKCSEQYDTDGIIMQEEFDLRPTFTLIFQQDNVDRINHAADNPLLVELYMRESPFLEDEGGLEEEYDGEDDEKMGISSLIENVERNKDASGAEHFSARITFKMVLLCVGFLDVIKLFGHSRSMVRENLYLYPMPDVQEDLRSTIHTEWHLYTLLPIAKQLTFTNMSFVTFESIYNLRDEYILDTTSMRVLISFRSRVPGDRNDFQNIPLCDFQCLERLCIGMQPLHHVFESFRRAIQPSNVTGLKSTMEVEPYRLFDELLCTDGMTVDFSDIDQGGDDALVCNSFHRFILTQKMADILSYAVTCQQYVLAVDVYQTVGYTKPQKVFQGVLDPSIMAYPGVQNMRFAVQLDYMGKLKPTSKRQGTVSIASSQRTDIFVSRPPTFAIIKLCLLAPIGEIYKELQVFRDSFVRQNRLLFCDQPLIPPIGIPLEEVQADSFARFDKFIRDCITFIIEKRVHKIEDRKQHFCCAVQNLANIMMKVIGSVYNTRTPTSTNVEFSNLCAIAYNDLEPRVHGMVEQAENEGFETFGGGRAEQSDRIMDYLNTIKLLRAAGDYRLANLFLDKAKVENPSDERFNFYMLILHMEFKDYEAAKEYYGKSHLANHYEYYANWIKLYLNYYDTRENPETTADCTECLLRSITMFAERTPRQPDAWILLYCYYKLFKYEPGCAYARWRFEDNQTHNRPTSPTAPHSLWGLFLAINPNFPSRRGQVFFEVFKMFVRLGLYEFAQVVFGVVENLCAESDRYMVRTQLAIFLDQLDDDFELAAFDFGEGIEAERAAAMNAQINGNVEYYRGRKQEASLYYQVCLTLPPPEENERDCFELSKLRLGYISYEMGDNYKCIEALNNPFSGKTITLVADYLMGKSYYRRDHLEVALHCFAKCTTAETHVPNVWGFLALINLKLGENYKAIECWKYAKIEPDRTIDDEMIFTELEAIDVDTIDLFTDVPGQAAEDLMEEESIN